MPCCGAGRRVLSFPPAPKSQDDDCVTGERVEYKVIYLYYSSSGRTFSFMVKKIRSSW